MDPDIEEEIRQEIEAVNLGFESAADAVRQEIEEAIDQVTEESSLGIREIPQPYQDIQEERDTARLLENARDNIEIGIQGCQDMVQMANSPYNRSWVAGVFGADFVEPFIGQVTDYWEQREEELQEQLSVLEELL